MIDAPRVLVACETSGIVRDAFLRTGHDAYSCDLLDAIHYSDRHIKDDALYVIQEGWDLIIAHPPCTHLCVSGSQWFHDKIINGDQQMGIDFFLEVVDLCNQHAFAWAIENPMGIMGKHYRQYDQVIQPYEYGDSYTKTTCLWLHNLLPLQPTNIVRKGDFYTSPQGRKIPDWCSSMNKKDRGKARSKTFQGIADAMANQWSMVVP